MKKLTLVFLVLLLAAACGERDRYIQISGHAQGGVYSVKVNLKGVHVAPETVRDSVEAILERIAEYQPQAITLLMPILPCGERKDDPRRLRVERINALVKTFADGGRVVWCDIGAQFLDQDGNVRRDLMPDFQHPLGKGYGVWRDALQPYFKSICKR